MAKIDQRELDSTHGHLGWWHVNGRMDSNPTEPDEQWELEDGRELDPISE